MLTSSTKQTRSRLLVLANFTTCLPPEIPRDIAFIPSILEHMQRLQVSWIRSIVLVIPHTAHHSFALINWARNVRFHISLRSHWSYQLSWLKQIPPTDAAPKLNLNLNLITLFIVSKYPWKSLQGQKIIKLWMLDFACHGRRLPALNFSYSCNVGRGEGRVAASLLTVTNRCWFCWTCWKPTKKFLVFKNKNGFVIVAVNLSFLSSFLCVNIFSRGVNLTVNKIPANKTFWKTRLDVWLRGGRSRRWLTNLLSSWSTLKSRHGWNSIACYNQIAARLLKCYQTQNESSKNSNNF